PPRKAVDAGLRVLPAHPGRGNRPALPSPRSRLPEDPASRPARMDRLVGTLAGGTGAALGRAPPGAAARPRVFHSCRAPGACPLSPARDPAPARPGRRTPGGSRVVPAGAPARAADVVLEDEPVRDAGLRSRGAVRDGHGVLRRHAGVHGRTPPPVDLLPRLGDRADRRGSGRPAVARGGPPAG